jgi:ABC-2 type transport system permease protein
MSVAIANTAHITTRHLRAFLRQPGYVLFTLVQPVIWLFVFGQLFQRVVEIPGFAGRNYIAFLTPGVVVMTALFNTTWSGTSFVVDMERGVMDRFLVTPVRRGALIGGELVYQAGMMVLLQSLIILGLGYPGGARFAGGIVSIVAFLIATMFLGMAFASYSNALALVLRSQNAVIGAVNFLVLPLAFLSSTFMPENLMPGWIQEFAKFNPVNWAVEVGRQMLGSSVDWSLVGVHLAELLALMLVFAWLSTRAFRAYQRSV